MSSPAPPAVDALVDAFLQVATCGDASMDARVLPIKLASQALFVRSCAADGAEWRAGALGDASRCTALLDAVRLVLERAPQGECALVEKALLAAVVVSDSPGGVAALISAGAPFLESSILHASRGALQQAEIGDFSVAHALKMVRVAASSPLPSAHALIAPPAIAFFVARCLSIYASAPLGVPAALNPGGDKALEASSAILAAHVSRAAKLSYAGALVAAAESACVTAQGAHAVLDALVNAMTCRDLDEPMDAGAEAAAFAEPLVPPPPAAAAFSSSPLAPPWAPAAGASSLAARARIGLAGIRAGLALRATFAHSPQVAEKLFWLISNALCDLSLPGTRQLRSLIAFEAPLLIQLLRGTCEAVRAHGAAHPRLVRLAASACLYLPCDVIGLHQRLAFVALAEQGVLTALSALLPALRADVAAVAACLELFKLCLSHSWALHAEVAAHGAALLRDLQRLMDGYISSGAEAPEGILVLVGAIIVRLGPVVAAEEISAALERLEALRDQGGGGGAIGETAPAG